MLGQSDIDTVIDDLGVAELGPSNRAKIFIDSLPAAKKGKASFTEIACVIFNKAYEDVNILKDRDAEARTNAAAAKAKAVGDKIINEKEAQKKAEEDQKKLQEKIQSNIHKVIYTTHYCSLLRHVALV